jgi:hypothetical protein
MHGTTHFVLDERFDLLLYWLTEFFMKEFVKPFTAEWAIQAAKQMSLKH